MRHLMHGMGVVKSRRPVVGAEVTHRVIVTADMTARLFGREIHPVYATAWMVRHAEEAGRLLVEPHLGPDEDATGYRIDVTHERPAAIGDRLTIIARVTRVDERECESVFEVRGPTGVVGRGTFVQRYVRRGRLGPTGGWTGEAE
jgi:fluoroacetyl-CoA thioesterase